MILNNYRIIKERLFNLTFGTQTAGQNPNTEISAKYTDGTAVKLLTHPYSNVGVSTMNSILKNYVRINAVDSAVFSGETIEPSADDYSLSNAIALTMQSVTNNLVFDNEKIKNTIVISGSNNTGSSQTIKSFGLIKDLIRGDAGSSMSTITQAVLIAEGNLAEPVTIPSGAGFTVVIEWVEG